MEKKQIKKAILFILMFFCVSLISNYALALNPDDYNPGKLQYSEGKTLFDKAAPVIKAITDIGIIGSVLALTIIGLKYMLGSTSEQKAQIKQTMLPLICGCLLIVGTFSLVKVIASISEERSESHQAESKEDAIGEDRYSY